MNINLKTVETEKHTTMKSCKQRKNTVHFPTEKNAGVFCENNQEAKIFNSTSENNCQIQIFEEKDLEESMKSYIKNNMNKWNSSLLSIKNQHPEFGYGGSNQLTRSLGNHIVNFLAYNLGKAVSRRQLEFISEKLIENNSNLKKSSDVIQLINKCDQKGLFRKKYKKNGVYLYGFEEIKFDSSRIAARIDTSTKEINEIKENNYKEKIDSEIKMLKNRIEILEKWKNDDFQKGHINPDKSLTDENLVMQPASFNQSYKDNYKFQEDGFQILCPTVKNIEKHPSKFWTDDEWTKIYEIAKKKLGKL